MIALPVRADLAAIAKASVSSSRGGLGTGVVIVLLCRSARCAVFLESFALRRISLLDFIVSDEAKKPGGWRGEVWL